MQSNPSYLRARSTAAGHSCCSVFDDVFRIAPDSVGPWGSGMSGSARPLDRLDCTTQSVAGKFCRLELMQIRKRCLMRVFTLVVLALVSLCGTGFAQQSKKGAPITAVPIEKVLDVNPEPTGKAYRIEFQLRGGKRLLYEIPPAEAEKIVERIEQTCESGSAKATSRDPRIWHERPGRYEGQSRDYQPARPNRPTRAFGHPINRRGCVCDASPGKN